MWVNKGWSFINKMEYNAIILKCFQSPFDDIFVTLVRSLLPVCQTDLTGVMEMF